MGDPRRLKTKFKRPTSPFEKTRLAIELKYLGEYGLRNKREFWRHKFQLSNFRKKARDLRAAPPNQQEIGFAELVGRLNRLGLVAPDAGTDDILSLSIEDILNRRLQTFVYKKGLARSIYQARQLVTHKHITVGSKVISAPSYLVLKEEENLIDYVGSSPFKGNPDKLFGERKSANGHDAPSRPRRTRKKSTRKKTSKSKE